MACYSFYTALNRTLYCIAFIVSAYYECRSTTDVKTGFTKNSELPLEWFAIFVFLNAHRSLRNKI